MILNLIFQNEVPAKFLQDPQPQPPIAGSRTAAPRFNSVDLLVQSNLFMNSSHWPQELSWSTWQHDTQGYLPPLILTAVFKAVIQLRVKTLCAEILLKSESWKRVTVHPGGWIPHWTDTTQATCPVCLQKREDRFTLAGKWQWLNWEDEQPLCHQLVTN